MSTAHLAGIDLNLLVHLDALLAEQHVTRAAGRVGITQSAMSRSLARLRLLLGDMLLVRAPGGMRPTVRARELAAPLRAALRALDAVVLGRPTFDPATARRTFTVVATDYEIALLLPALGARLAREAPSCDLAFLPGGRDAWVLEDDTADLAVMPRRPGSAALVWRKLFRDHAVGVVRRGHPCLARRLTLARFLALPQLLIAPAGRAGSQLDEALAAVGKRRRVAVRAPSFLIALETVASSDLLLAVPRGLAEVAARRLPLELVPLPVALEPFDIFLAWHEQHRGDPGHAWFRELVASVLASPPVPPPRAGR